MSILSKKFDEKIAELTERRVSRAAAMAKAQTNYEADEARKLASNILRNDWQKASMGPLATKVATFLGNMSKDEAAANEGKMMTFRTRFNGETYVKYRFNEIDQLAIQMAVEELGEDPNEVEFRRGSEVYMPEETLARVQAKLKP